MRARLPWVATAEPNCALTVGAGDGITAAWLYEPLSMRRSSSDSSAMATARAAAAPTAEGAGRIAAAGRVRDGTPARRRGDSKRITRRLLSRACGPRHNECVPLSRNDAATAATPVAAGPAIHQGT